MLTILGKVVIPAFMDELLIELFVVNPTATHEPHIASDSVTATGLLNLSLRRLWYFFQMKSIASSNSQWFVSETAWVKYLMSIRLDQSSKLQLVSNLVG